MVGSKYILIRPTKKFSPKIEEKTRENINRLWHPCSCVVAHVNWVLPFFVSLANWVLLDFSVWCFFFFVFCLFLFNCRFFLIFNFLHWFLFFSILHSVFFFRVHLFFFFILFFFGSCLLSFFFFFILFFKSSMDIKVNLYKLHFLSLNFFIPNQTPWEKTKIFFIIKLFYHFFIFYLPTFSLLQPNKPLRNSSWFEWVPKKWWDEFLSGWWSSRGKVFIYLFFIFYKFF